MTDALRPNPLGLPLAPDAALPSEGPVEAPPAEEPAGRIDDPVLWPVGGPDAPDEPDGGSLDLPGDVPDAPDAQVRRRPPDPRIA
jgi:hypothetical protein